MAKAKNKENKKNNKNVANEEDFTIGAIAGLDEDDSDFSVGKIAGLDDTVKESTTKKESVADMPTTLEKEKTTNVKKDEKEKQFVISTGVKAEDLEGTVSLKIHKNNMPLAEIVAKKNDGVIVQQFENHFQLNAKQIRVTRQDAENVLGRMNDGRWRMLLMNRDGEIANLNNYELVLGVVQTETEENKETAQLNTRILAESKQDMDEIRALLNMTQAQFLEVAIAEYVEKVRAEMI